MSFRDAKIVGDDVDPAIYAKETHERGEAGYVISRSSLMTFAHCPARWLAGYQQKATDALDFGSLADTLFLQPHRFLERYAVKPLTYKNDKGEEKPWNGNSNVCRAWLDDCGKSGKLPVHAEDVAEAKLALRRIDTIRETRNQVEIRATYQDAEDISGEGTTLTVPVKALIDIVPDAPADWLADYKTSISAHPRAWAKAVNQYNYDAQGAFFLDLFNAATGEERKEFRHIVQENYPPFEVGRRTLSAEFLSLGRDKYLKALRLYCKCLKTGVWPSYDAPSEWTVTEPELWMIGQWS